jgi:hypothetical protein
LGEGDDDERNTPVRTKRNKLHRSLLVEEALLWNASHIPFVCGASAAARNMGGTCSTTAAHLAGRMQSNAYDVSVRMPHRPYVEQADGSIKEPNAPTPPGMRAMIPPHTSEILPVLDERLKKIEECIEQLRERREDIKRTRDDQWTEVLEKFTEIDLLIETRTKLNATLRNGIRYTVKKTINAAEVTEVCERIAALVDLDRRFERYTDLMQNLAAMRTEWESTMQSLRMFESFSETQLKVLGVMNRFGGSIPVHLMPASGTTCTPAPARFQQVRPSSGVRAVASPVFEAWSSGLLSLVRKLEEFMLMLNANETTSNQDENPISDQIALIDCMLAKLGYTSDEQHTTADSVANYFTGENTSTAPDDDNARSHASKKSKRLRSTSGGTSCSQTADDNGNPLLVFTPNKTQ